MQTTTTLAIALAASTALWAISAPDVAARDADTFEPINEALLGGLRQNTAREEYIANILRPLRELDEDQDGLDALDVERQTTKRAAQERANLASQLLSMDYDGDLKVSREEIERFAPGDAERKAQAAWAAMQRFDTDSDGVATLEEAIAAMPPSRGISNRDRLGEMLIALDPDGDGRLTVDELRGLATDAFDTFDVDRNGIISSEEAQAIYAEMELAKEIRNRRESGCFFQQPSAKALLVGYAPYGGQTVSSSYIGNEGIETSVIDVTIERGKQPLYLVLTTYDSVIWRFEGAVDRVERVVVASYASKDRRGSDRAVATSASGVIGLAADKVRVANRDCLPDFSKQDEIDAGVPQQGIKALFGRLPDAIGRENPVATVQFPSLKAARVDWADKPALPSGFDPVVWEEASRFWPGGLAMIDPESVVAAEPVAPYAVYPNQIGLSQLVGAGNLSYSGEAHGQGRYTILRTFPYFPASMGGAHSATFILPQGVDLPRGSVGHGCVLSEEDAAKPNWKRLCEPAPVRPLRMRD